MGQDVLCQGSYLKITEVDDFRVEIENIGNKIVMISYHGIEKEIKQNETITILKIVLDDITARLC